MFRQVMQEVWAFDVEWVPDPAAGRLLYDLPENLPDSEVLDEMWRRNGATDDNPRPFLRTLLYRVLGRHGQAPTHRKRSARA